MNAETAPELTVKRKGLLRRMIRYGVIALVIVSAGVYVARRQIGGALARKLDERLVAAGIYITWESAAWVPGPGIRLKNVALFRDADRHERLALLGNVEALKGDPAWDRWDTVNVRTHDADFVLGNGANETEMKDLSLDLLIQPGKAELNRFQALLRGLRIESKGSFVRADTPAINATPAAPARPGTGLFDQVTLDWLHTVKEWVSFSPEQTAPVLKLEFHSQPDGSSTDLNASFDGKSFGWRGQQWDVMQMAVKSTVGDKPSPVEISQVRIGHAGQVCDVTGIFDPAKKELRVSKFDSGIDLLALARAFSPEATKGLAAVSTQGGWRIRGDGEIPVEQPMKTRWKGDIALNGALAYASGSTKVSLNNPAMKLNMADEVVTASDFKTGLWGGTFQAPETRVYLAGTPRFETRVRLDDAHLQSVMGSFSTSQNMPGIVHLDWQGGGGFDLSSIKGGGSLAIHQAEFFRIPLLGPLHLVFDQLTPGFGRDVASTLNANHRLGDSTLFIQNLKLESKTTRIEADGSVNLTSQYARMTAKAKLQGIVGLTTALLSALLEVEGEGPVSDMRWKLKNIPGMEVIGGAAKVVGKTGEVVVGGAANVVKGTVKGTAGVATEAVKGTGKAVKGILKLPGKLIPGKN